MQIFVDADACPVVGIIEKIAKEHNYEIEAFCGDVGSCCANQCDVIFISEELADRIKDRAQVPVVAIKNFMNKKEVEEKTLAYLEENCK